jgi:hypothetical protein
MEVSGPCTKHQSFVLKHSLTPRLPLAHTDATTATASPVSSAKIPASLDKQMDKSQPTNGEIQPGISISHGPVKEDTEMQDLNGTGAQKRKVSRPSYADAESSDDDLPIVRYGLLRLLHSS